LGGYDQGVVSIVLVMERFLQQFPRVSERASGAGFWRDLLKAMIELGTFFGALNQGWIADEIFRKYPIIVARCYLHHRVRLSDCRCRLCDFDDRTVDWEDQHRHAVDGSSSVYLRNQSA
jgi:hypothetical protein